MKFLPAAKSDGWCSNDQKFARGLLGVSEVQEWGTYRKTLTIKSSEFERIPSPVVFKIFDKENDNTRVYLFGRNFYEQLLGKTFEFTMSGCSGSLSLNIPSSFEIRGFLVYAVGEINKLGINNIGTTTTGLVKKIDDILTKVKSAQIKEL
jgi:hypothetical protein